MKEILDIIVGNTFLFVGVILFLVATFLVLVRGIVKTINNHKIPIYEEDSELEELEEIIEEDVIEKPVKKKDKKGESKKAIIEEAFIEEENSIDEEIVEEKEEDVIEEEIVEKKSKKKNGKTEEIIEEEEKVEIEEPSDEIEETTEEKEEEEIDEPNREKLEKIDDKEIEERINKEHKKGLKEEIEKSDNDEIKELLSDMTNPNEVDPEEVVKNFEEEQEAQSIISYQELVDVVKNRDNEFVDELETKPLSTVSSFIAETESDIEPDIEVLEIIEQLEKSKEDSEPKVEELLAITDYDVEHLELSVEEIEVLEPVVSDYQEENIKEDKKKKEIVKEILPEIADAGRFKKTDVISPIFGKMEEIEAIDYPKVEKFSREKAINIPNRKLADKVMQSVVSKIEEEELDKLTMKDDVAEIDLLEKEEIANRVMKTVTNKLHIEEEEETDDIEKEAAEALKSFSSIFEDITEKIEKKENLKEKEKLIEEAEEEEIESLTTVSNISKNEDFLKALKDFRNNL
jgi:AAA ATPase containing von Willebrand factor type A (vWA) domain